MHGLVRCTHECRCSHVRGADVIIRDVTIKTPYKKWDRGREWRHARKRWGFLEFEKKTIVIWDSSLEESNRFLGSTKCAVRGGVRWKSQHRKKLCHSLLVLKNLKLKQVNNKFHAWTNFVYFGIPYVHFTYSYLGGSRGPFMILHTAILHTAISLVIELIDWLRLFSSTVCFSTTNSWILFFTGMTNLTYLLPYHDDHNGADPTLFKSSAKHFEILLF